jgi:hypothetical protein
LVHGAAPASRRSDQVGWRGHARRTATVRVGGITAEALEKAVRPHALRVIDVRTLSPGTVHKNNRRLTGACCDS